MKIGYIISLFFVILFAGCGKIEKLYRIDMEEEVTVAESENNILHPDFIRLKDGTLLVVFTEQKSDVPGSWILMCRSRSGVAGWSKPGTVIESGWMCYNPVVTQLKDGLIIIVFNQSRLDYKTGKEIPEGIFIVQSFDNGKTFTAPRMIPAGEKSSLNVSGGIMESDNGDLLVGVYNPSGREKSYVGVIISVDRGETWDRMDIFSEDNKQGLFLINPSIIRIENGNLICLMQDRAPQGFIYESISKDGGRTWSLPFRTCIEGSFPGITESSTGSLVAVFKDMWPDGITIVRSYNNGITWEDEETVKGATGSCSNPVIKSFDDKLYIAFSQRAGQQDSKSRIGIIICKDNLPKSPAGLSASVNKNKHIHLRWNEMGSADYYVVYRDTVDAFDSELLKKKIATVSEPCYVDCSVKLGQSYFYAVTQVIGRGRLISGTGMESRASKVVKIVVE